MVSLHAFKLYLPCGSWSRSPVCYVVFHHESCWLHALLLVLSLSAVPYQLRKRSFLAFTGVFLSFWLLSSRVSPSYLRCGHCSCCSQALSRSVCTQSLVPPSFPFSRRFVRWKLSCCHEIQPTLETVYFARPERSPNSAHSGRVIICCKEKKKISEVAFFSLYICLSSFLLHNLSNQVVQLRSAVGQKYQI